MRRDGYVHNQPRGKLYSRRRLMQGAVVSGSGGAALLAGCRSPSSRGTSAGSPASGAGPPRSGGQFNFSSKFDVDSFDVSGMQHGGSDLSPTVDSLLSIKSGPGVQYTDLTLTAGLAETWETPDAQVYTFHLRPNLNFADLPPVNGRAVTSADVKWSLEYMSRTGQFGSLPKAPVSGLFEGLQQVQTPDGSTVVLQFKQPFAPFLTTAGLEWSAILAREVYDQDGGFSKRVVGTGPWQLDVNESQPGSSWVYKKNPAYYRKGLPYLGQLNRKTIADDAASTAAFQTKQLDYLNYVGLDLDTVQQMKKALPGALVNDNPTTSTMFIYMNQARPPLNDARVRQAFGLTINRDEFIKALSAGRGEWALAGGLPGLFTPAEIRQILKYDPAQARQLLGAAGYANGLDIELIYPPKKYGQTYDTGIELLQSQAKQAGINLILKPVDAGIEKTRRLGADFQLGTSPSPPGLNADLEFALYLYYHPASPSNYARVNDPQLTQLLDAERREADPVKRRDLIRQAVRRVNEVPVGLATYYGREYELLQPYVKDYAPNMAAFGSVPPLIYTWLAKG